MKYAGNAAGITIPSRKNNKVNFTISFIKPRDLCAPRTFSEIPNVHRTPGFMEATGLSYIKECRTNGLNNLTAHYKRFRLIFLLSVREKPPDSYRDQRNHASAIRQNAKRS